MKSVVITGGNKGIGLGISRAFVEAGYRVIVGARSEAGELAGLGSSVKFIQANVSKPEDHLKLVQEANAGGDRLECYINNAGFSAWKPIEQIDPDFLRGMMETNIFGAFWGCKAAASLLPEGGSIINVSSIAGKRGSSNNSAYVATKFAMNGLTQSLAKELGPRGIRVNGVCPVLILTEGLREALLEEYSPAGGNIDTFLENFKNGNVALGRFPTAQEVGDTCVYLASAKASAITGQNINVDCGVFPQ